MQNKFKKYTPILLLGFVFNSAVVNAEELKQADDSNTPTYKEQATTEYKNQTEDKIIQDRQNQMNQKAEDQRIKMEERKADLNKKTEDRKIKIEEKRIEMDKKLEDRKIKIGEIASDRRNQIDTRKEDAIKKAIENRKQFEEKKEAIKQESKSRSEEARESLKKTLDLIKDEKKKASVENIANIIGNANKNTSTRFSNNVNSIENVLISIKSRSSKLQEAGADVSELSLEITKTEELISEARKAIADQSAKVYTIDSTDPTKIKETMKSVRDTFNSDIKKVQEKIKIARDGVKKNADTLKKIKPVVKSMVDTNTSESSSSVN
jgi:hypothetical protein